MKDLLALAIESHGGQARWDAIRTVTAELSIGGALWAFKGKAGILQDARYEADVHVQRATLGRFTAPDRRVRFTRDRLVLETDAGVVIETRDNPRSAVRGSWRGGRIRGFLPVVSAPFAARARLRSSTRAANFSPQSKSKL